MRVRLTNRLSQGYNSVVEISCVADPDLTDCDEKQRDSYGDDHRCDSRKGFGDIRVSNLSFIVNCGAENIIFKLLYLRERWIVQAEPMSRSAYKTKTNN